ncbi:hypothetical protein ElyMa_000006200 [Elysia marginata]|uniref:SMB domain-containing protein n=1 Tax=Elysia marginata TaxID=1093978 RepID=A0AAV4EAG2_9GAST|nr:hypothetical protein ElyMa_000006200 [Elysia marginata]
MKKIDQIAGLVALIVLCFNTVRSTEINFSVDNWKEFVVYHCGLVCQNGTRVRLYAEQDCEMPTCFQCNCHPTCSKLDTCCPEGVVHPNGSVTLAEKEPEEPNMMPPFSKQIQCGAIFDSRERDVFVRVASCPPLVRTSNTSQDVALETRKMCEGIVDDDLPLGFLGPYVDVQTGLVFRNKFCALCNGYSLSTASTLSELKTLTGAYERRVVTPWSIRVNCSNYQQLYTLKSQNQLLDKASTGRLRWECVVLYDEALSNRQPSRCFMNRYTPEDYENLNCEATLMTLCRNVSDPYLNMNGVKNMFCHVCEGKRFYRVVRKNTVCFTYSGIDMNHFLHPPISLLLGVSAQNSLRNIEKLNECTATTRWVDDRVSI